MRARRLARRYAAHHFGRAAARSVARYEACATSLAFLRHRGRSGRAGADFVVRERELLHELWRRREVARPSLAYAARVTAPAVPVPPPRPAYGPGYGYGYGYVPVQPSPRDGRPYPDPTAARPVYGPYRP